MENKNQNTVFYSLNEEDIQNVASQEIDRKLSEIEIESIKELLVVKYEGATSKLTIDRSNCSDATLNTIFTTCKCHCSV